MDAPSNPPVDYVGKPIESEERTPPAVGPAEQIGICMETNDNGWFQLSWTSPAPDEWDWIGIFPSTSAGDTEQVTYQWATKTSPWVSSQAARPGYQARYLRWNSDAKAYQALLRTPPFPDRVAANTYDMTTWMSLLTNHQTSLADVTLPSAAWGMYDPKTQTQSISIADQLAGGVRFLDIRLKLKAGELWLYHGIIYLGLSFDDVLGPVTKFLDAHPTETVVMSVKNEDGSQPDEFATVFKTRYVDPRASGFYLGDLVPTIREGRGRIVLMRRFGIPAVNFPKAFGLNLSSGWTDDNADFTISYRSQSDPKRSLTARVQDLYDTGVVATKWKAANDLLTVTESGRPGEIYLNFASAASWVRTYGMAAYINPLLYAAIASPSGRRFGWIPMDYPNLTPWLIYALAVSNLAARPVEAGEMAR
jgi:1-phosphatidylinositol phosphodiesterase